jgi:CO/xanthine dehydrogenase FAD-binding subunit
VRTFEYRRPESIDELLALTSAHPDAALLCGGTDLMVRIKGGWLPPVVIYLKRVAGLLLCGP